MTEAGSLPGPRHQAKEVCLVVDLDLVADGVTYREDWTPVVAFDDGAMAGECVLKRNFPERVARRCSPRRFALGSYAKRVRVVETVRRCRNIARFPDFKCSVCFEAHPDMREINYCPGCGREICNG